MRNTKKASVPAPEAPSNTLALDLQLCFALHSTSLAMTKVYKPLLDPLSLTYPQYVCMLALWQHGSQSVSQLGEHLFLDSGTLTPLCKRLEGLGLVTRVRDKGDERRVMVTLTLQGHALRDQAARIPACAFAAVGCSLAEVQSMTHSLQALRQNMQAHLACTPDRPASTSTIFES